MSLQFTQSLEGPAQAARRVVCAPNDSTGRAVCVPNASTGPHLLLNLTYVATADCLPCLSRARGEPRRVAGILHVAQRFLAVRRCLSLRASRGTRFSPPSSGEFISPSCFLQCSGWASAQLASAASDPKALSFSAVVGASLSVYPDEGRARPGRQARCLRPECLYGTASFLDFVLRSGRDCLH